MQNISRYYNMYEEEKEEDVITSNKLKNYIGEDISSLEEIKTNGYELITIGSGSKVIDQYPKKGQKLAKGAKIFVLTAKENITVPNMIGWSKIDILRFCNLANIKCNFNGTGYATSQSVPEGSKASEITVNLEDVKFNE